MPASLDVDYRQLALDIAGGELTAGGRLRLRVIGDSMAPLLCDGDYVFVAPMSAAMLQRGDLVVVLRNGDVITHRIVGRGRQGWQTKGDNRRQSDHPHLNEKILGRVVTVHRRNEILNLKDRRARVANRLLGLLGACEAAAFQRGAAARSAFPSQGTDVRLTALARLTAEGFKVLRKFVYKTYTVEPS